MKFIKTSVEEQREKDKVQADVAVQQSKIDYVAMMCGVDIPTEDEETNKEETSNE